MWERWNSTTHIFEKSSDDGAIWTPLNLDGAVITEGLVAVARLGTGSPSATTALFGDGTWKSIATSIIALAYPVGSIYTNADVSTNPATLLGFGTWVLFGVGRVEVCIDSGQTEFDVLGETGGFKTHTLTSAEMPVHTHVQNSHNHTQDVHNHTQNSHNHTQDSHNHSQNAHNHTQDTHNHSTSYGSTQGLQAGSDWTAPGTSGNSTGNTTATNQAATATNNSTTATNQATTATNIAATATNQVATAVNQNTGGDGAHNNLQPYIVVARWRRSA